MKLRSLSLVIFCVLLLTTTYACSAQSGAEATLPLTETSAPIPPTDTPAVPSETPQIPGVVILLSPAQGWEEEQAAVEAAVTGRGLTLEVRQDLSVESAPANLQIVVMFGVPGNASDLAVGLPEVIFLGVGGSGWPDTANMYVIGLTEANSPNQAFLAGYIAAVQSEEYRIGIISVNDPAGQTYRNAFLNGVIYFCGTCTPFYPPFEIYPVYSEVIPGADQAALEAAAQNLLARRVTMVHVAPPLQSDAIYQYLAQNGVRLIGTSAPPAGLEENWVASVVDDGGTSLENAVRALLNGEETSAAPASLKIDFAGVSQARLDHFYEILTRLETGEIDPVGQ
jgi:hypothetical protein